MPGYLAAPCPVPSARGYCSATSGGARLLRPRVVPLALCAAVVALTVAQPLAAQTFPNRAVRVVVAFPPGGSTDIFARMTAERLAALWGQPVTIENRPGASSIIGTEAVARAKPDGYTLLFGTAGALSINPHLFAKLPYDAQKDFVPLAQVASLPLMIVAHPSLPVKTVKDLVALAQKRPGQIDFASVGVGTSQHLAGEMLSSMTGIKLNHIAYKGSAPAINDLLGGHVTLMFDTTTSALPHVQAGKLRPIAVTTRERIPAAPSVPTVAEQVPGFEALSWSGYLAPAGTPADAVERISRDVVTIMRDPSIRERVTSQGAIPSSASGAEFATFLRAEFERWGKAVRFSGAKLE